MTHGKSVVVPVDAEKVLDAAAAYLRQQYGASHGLDHPIDRQRILSSIPSAPAPSSLAGGEWNREDHGNSTLLYTLKERGWRKGEPIMVNDKTVRIEFDGDREPVIAAILAALSPEAPALDGECITMQSLNDATSDPEWCAKWNRAPSALTPDAPAEGGE